MDSNNFVGKNGNGYDVYSGGKKVGTYPDLTSAQNAFNQAQAGSTTTPAKTGSATTTTGDPAASLQGILDAIASGDQAQLDEKIREFNADLAEKEREYNLTTTDTSRQFDINTGLKEQDNYTNLASDLLKTAASLRGPSDYYQYNQYLSGGRDLMSQLYGNQPTAAFSKPTGQVTPLTIDQLMSGLGFKQTPQLPTSVWDPVAGKWTTPQAPPPGSSTIYGPATPSASAAPAGNASAAAAPAAPAANPPVYDKGGPVKGPPGSHILAILQAGERVIPANKAQVSTGPRRGPTRYTKQGLPIFDDGGVVPAPTGNPSIPDKPVTSNPTQLPNPTTTTPISNSGIPWWALAAAAGGGSQTDVNNAAGTPPPMQQGPTLPKSPQPIAPGQPPIANPYPLGPPQYNWTGNGFSPVPVPPGEVVTLDKTASPSPAASTTPPPAAAPAAPAPAAPTTPPPDASTAPPAASPPVPAVPLPYQINPATYDSMSPTGKALLQSLAAANGWDWNDFLAELNAQRPTGTVAPNTIYNYYTPTSSRSSTEGFAGAY